MNLPTLKVTKSNLPGKRHEMLSDLIIDPKELLDILELDVCLYPGVNCVAPIYPRHDGHFI
ncbi:MAG: hypothetical protein VX881_05570 [Pseudomonadota bacterium]|nr:hypothetical protein [Pseudomonadota bacterium]